MNSERMNVPHLLPRYTFPPPPVADTKGYRTIHPSSSTEEKNENEPNAATMPRILPQQRSQSNYILTHRIVNPRKMTCANMAGDGIVEV